MFESSPLTYTPLVETVGATAVVAVCPLLFVAYDHSAIKAERRAIMIQSFVRMRVVHVSLCPHVTCLLSPPDRVATGY